MAELRKKINNVSLWKHNEMFISGIPDLEVGIPGIGYAWIEIKLVGKNGSFKPNKNDFPRLQNAELDKRATIDPATYTVFVPCEAHAWRMVVISAAPLWAALESGQEVVAETKWTLAMDMDLLVWTLRGGRGNAQRNWFTK